MKHIDWDNVQESKGFEKLPAGGYVCGITAVEDYPSKEYLEIEFDIAEGEHKNEYRSLYDEKGFWAGKFRQSYSKKGMGYFKKMLIALEKSNPGFKYNDDEKMLKRKLIGLVIGYREGVGQDGNVREYVDVQDFVSVSDIRSGNFIAPKIKRLENSVESGTAGYSANKSAFNEVEDDGDIPF